MDESHMDESMIEIADEEMSTNPTYLEWVPVIPSKIASCDCLLYFHNS